MQFKSLMFVAAFGLASTAFAGGDKDKNKDDGTSAQLEQPAEEAEKHSEKAKEHADKAAESAERAQEQAGQQAQQQPTTAEERAAEQEMEALMAEEIERRVDAAEQAPEKRVFGKVMGITQEEIILDIGGAALPVTVDRSTKIEGEAIPRTKRIQSHLNSEFQAGQLISVTYDLKNMKNVALSIEELKQEGTQQRPMGTQQPMGSEEPMGTQERPMGSQPEGGMGSDMEPRP